MGIRKIKVKNSSLKRVFFLYSLSFLTVIFLFLVIFYSAFVFGESLRLYYFANRDEKQVELLQQRIEKEQNFDPSWVPSPIKYFVMDKNNTIISSNASKSDQVLAQKFSEGKSIKKSDGYFVKVSYPKGNCIFKYRIGMRYSSAWANKYLPSFDLIYISLLSLVIFLSTIIYVKLMSKRIQKDLSPLKQSVDLIREGNLENPIPHLSIQEFEELGVLTERMRLDLKSSLEIMWTNENQLKESTTQMLHDYRTPLTVAKANSEFLKEDLLNLESNHTNDKLLAYTEAIRLNLDQLIYLCNRLQEQLQNRESKKCTQNTLTFDEFNKSLDTLGNSLSEHYKDKWVSNYQRCTALVSVDELGLKQTISNIIINAFEHGKSPQVVKIEFSIHEEFYEYLISNSGSKFSGTALAKATDKEFSEKSNDTQFIKGLGLYFAKKFLDNQHSKLLIYNSKDGNATVQIRLPIEQKS